MKKRILCFVLCLVVLLPAFMLGANAQTEPTEEVTESTEEVQEKKNTLEILNRLLVDGKTTNEDQRLRQQILRTHIKTLEETGHDSLGGRCGLQVSWELYLLGINQVLYTHHGKDHYDFYSAMTTTSGGHTVRAYSAEKYSLLQALNLITQNAAVDVYNVMVGFERTNTEAGALYGHVCFIHGILDGMVYFVEGFGTPFGTVEGEPVVVSMEQFAHWFSQWTEYEGLVYFGTKSPLDSCAYTPADLFVECTGDVELISQPAQENSDLVRKACLGERLHVTGIYEDMQGQIYCRISEDGAIAYALAQRLEPAVMNYESLVIQEPVVPQLLEVGQRFKPGGKIQSDLLGFEQVRLVITDEKGQNVADVQLMEQGSLCDLDRLDIQKKVDTSGLEAGIYTYSILADVSNGYVTQGQIQTEKQTLCLLSARFGVGQTQAPEQLPQQPRQLVQGWNYEQGKWYYYENNQPWVGWLGYKGHDYYLDETGAAVTGWVQINGKMRYFSQTGTMRTGWIQTEKGMGYLLRNGVLATGWRTVEGRRYCFDQDGVMQTGGWAQLDGQWYYFYETGAAATGWVTLGEQIYSFHANGNLLAKRVEQDGKIQIVNYDGTWQPI